MKQFLLLVMSFVFSIAIAQEEETNDGLQSSTFNKWSIDLNGGISRPTTAFKPGYFVDNLSFFHIDLGARHMFNPKFGFKFDLGYDNFENSSKSLPFKSAFYRANIQGVVNLGRLFNFEDFAKNLNFQAHTGPGYAILTSDGFDGEDQIVNFLLGLTAQYKLTEKIAFNADFTMVNNVRQHKNFDGSSFIGDDRGFKGTLYNATLGFSFYLGSNETHADWTYEMKDEKQAELESRLAEVETMMNDTDRDGVPDYLDVENNTTNGIAVDSKGRAIDLNNNGVPDELEKYVDARTKEVIATTSISNQKESKPPLELINSGYVNVFFDTDSFYPKSYSTNDIYFVINYLKENPSASVDIIGSADTRGLSEYNSQLSQKRAERVKFIVEQAGIDSSRLTIVPLGEDDSLGDGSTNNTLVRKVTFKIK